MYQTSSVVSVCEKGCRSLQGADIDTRGIEWLPISAVSHQMGNHLTFVSQELDHKTYLECPNCHNKYTGYHGFPNDCRCGYTMIFYGNQFLVWPTKYLPADYVPYWEHFHPDNLPPFELNVKPPEMSASSQPEQVVISPLGVTLLATVMLVLLGVFTKSWVFFPLAVWGTTMTTLIFVNELYGKYRPIEKLSKICVIFGRGNKTPERTSRGCRYRTS